MKIRIFFIGFFVLLAFVREGGVWAKEEKPKANQQRATTTGVTVPPRVPNVPQIQKELERILEIHRTLQQQNYNQIREIQRITEQARAHQKLLDTLQSLPKVTPPGRVNLDEVERVEKIRLIQEQAQKNRAALEEMQKEVPPSPENQKGKPVKPSKSKEKPKKTPFLEE